MSYDLNNIVKLAKVTEPTIFTDEQLETINRLIMYQDYYENRSFKYISETSKEYRQYHSNRDYMPANIPLNYGKFIIDKLAAWQFEIGIDFNCESEISPARADEIEKDLYDIHKKNLMDIKLLQSATESNIAGSVTFKLKYEEDESYPRILVRNRIETFAITEFDDYEKLIRVHFIAFQDDKTIWKQTYELIKNEVTKKNVCYISEALFDTKNIETPKKVILKRQPLGFNGKWLDFLPVYIVPNMAQLGMIDGISEMRDLIPIIDEINKKYSDLSDSLRFDMFAITVFMNAKIPTGADGKPQLINKANAAWNIVGLSPTDNIKPEVFKLQGTFNYLPSIQYHVDGLMAALFELSECVNITPATVAGLTALSGVALKLLFASIISKTARKNIVWKSKLEEIYMGALKIKQIYEGYDIPDDLDIEVILHIPVPSNELEAVQVATEKIAAGLSSVTTEMNNLGIEDPEAELAKILEERLQYDKTLNIDTRNQTPTDNTNNQGNLNGNQ